MGEIAMTELLKKVQAYKEVQRKIEELEEQKKLLVSEILDLMPKDEPSVQLDAYRVKRTTRLSIRISIQDAEAFGAVKMEKMVDRKMIKELFQQGKTLPDVSEITYIQVYTNSGPKEETSDSRQPQEQWSSS
ncbi:MAG: hypothetical protein JSR93_07310 [Verrucomicrobia bacterium]|nr:hypothetical protein [Verrucomicrobiota bacterium]